MNDLSLAARMWLNGFRIAHPDVHADRIGGSTRWLVTVPLSGDGEQTLGFDTFGAMRSWLDRWAAGR